MADKACAWRDLLKKIDETLAEIDAVRAGLDDSDVMGIALCDELDSVLRRDRDHVAQMLGRH